MFELKPLNAWQLAGGHAHTLARPSATFLLNGREAEHREKNKHMAYKDQASFALSLSNVDNAVDRASLDRVMKDLVASYGLKSAAYIGSGTTGKTGSPPVLAVTYSSKWVERYTEQHFVEIDPVIHMGFRRLLPLDWNDCDRSDGRVKTMFGEASEFGLGSRGLSIPIHGWHGDRGLFSITSDLSERDWVREKLLYLRDFQVIAMHVHGKILELEGYQSAPVKLSPRELECLLWIAEGKTAWECSRILGLSQHTVRCYLESARHKLNATSNTHAVSIAHKAGLLFDLL